MAISLLDFRAQIREPQRQGLIEEITNESLFLRRLNFIRVEDFSYRYSKRDKLGGIGFRALNAPYTDAEKGVGVINPVTETLAVFGGEVDTDRQIANKPNGRTVRANHIAGKLRKAGLFFDKNVIDGDTAADGRQFDGVNARLTGKQVIEAGANGDQLTLAMVDDLIDAVRGSDEMKTLVMNKANLRRINQLRVQAAGGAAVVDVGMKKPNYGGVEIEIIDEDGDEEPILGFDETQGTSNLASSIYCFRFGGTVDETDFQGLVGSNLIEHEDQGVRGTQYIDLVEGNFGIALFHSRCAARLKGILDAA